MTKSSDSNTPSSSPKPLGAKALETSKSIQK